MISVKKPLWAITGALLLFAFFTQNSSAQYRFYCGEDWANIENADYSPAIKKELKTTMLKTAQESSILTGNPILPVEEKDFAQYLTKIDSFYKKPDAKAIPLYFALKLAEMRKRNFPEQQIQAYRTAISQKMRKIASLSAESDGK